MWEHTKHVLQVLRPLFVVKAVPHGQTDTAPARYFWVGIFVALVAMGLPLVGMTVNLWLGAAMLALAFLALIKAFWIWEKTSRYHVVLRVLTVCLAALLYFGLAGQQIAAEWKREQVHLSALPEQGRPGTKPQASASENSQSPIVQEDSSKQERVKVEDKVSVKVTRAPGVRAEVKRAEPMTAMTERAYDLSGQRRKQFLELLKKSQAEPRDTIRIGCISWSESSCVAAGRFLILFSEAGWKIDEDRVFRLEPNIPIEGVAIVSYPETGEPLPPHLGRWHKMSNSQVTIWTAFNQMGVRTSGSSDNSLPPTGMTGVYFGPEPQAKQQ